MKHSAISTLVLLVIASLLLGACGGQSDNVGPKVTSSGFECPEPSPRLEVTSKTLNLFVWTEYIPQDIIECFSLVYDIQVNREEFSSNEELYAKLQSGAEGYDVVHPSDYIINVMIRSDLIVPLDKSQLPNMVNIDPGYLQLYGDRADYVVPYQLGSQAIMYDADRVPIPPQSWADLWKPEYADRMVFVDDSRVIIGMTLLTLGYDINTTDPAQLEEARVKLAELIPSVKVFDSDSPKTPLIAGDVDLGVVWNGEAFLAQRELPSVQYVFPSEGAIIFEDGFAITKGAAHIDAAYAWMNYTLQADVAWLLLQDYPYTIPNRAALEFARQNHPDLYDAYSSSNISNTPADILMAGHQVEDVGAALPLYDEIWTQVKGGE